MSLWEAIRAAIEALAKGQSLSEVFDRLRKPPEKTIAFTIAVIALAAKMAKADGTVTRNEVQAFRQIFEVAPEAEKEAARVFNLARQDVAGFDIYAQKLRKMFVSNPRILEDLFEGLVFIAMADGTFHRLEAAFLQKVAAEFELSPETINLIYARQNVEGYINPYFVLGASHEMGLPEIKSLWRARVMEMHPDKMLARGVPAEAIKLAETRLASINEAWRQIQLERS